MDLNISLRAPLVWTNNAFVPNIYLIIEISPSSNLGGWSSSKGDSLSGGRAFLPLPWRRLLFFGRDILNQSLLSRLTLRYCTKDVELVGERESERGGMEGVGVRGHA